MSIKILIAEDHPSWQRIFRDGLPGTILEDEIYVKVVSSFNESLDALDKEAPWDLAIIDIYLPHQKGEIDAQNSPQNLGQILADKCHFLQIPVIGTSDRATAREVRNLFVKHKVFDFIDKEEYHRNFFINTVKSALISAAAIPEPEPHPHPQTQGCFSWLHLTDLHRGMSQQSYLWQNIRQIFFNDLRKLHDKCGPWDLVLFTGDLTQRGSKEEFEQLDELLEELWEKLRQLGSSPYLLAVPGNHDLTRPDPEDPSVILLNEWQNRNNIQQKFWDNPKSSYRQLVVNAFEGYNNWWIGKDHKHKPKKNINIGILPGDFSFTLEKTDGSKLGILGLNTSFLQLTDDNYEGKLTLDPRQFHQACGGDGILWANQHHICLLLTHHPPIWLNQQAREDLDSEINPYGRFCVHLCGHMHETTFREIAEAGTYTRRMWQGCSLFGLEYIDTAKRIQRSHGYTVGQVQLDDDKGKLVLFPRKVWLQGGNRQIIPDPDVELIDNWHTVPREFPLLQTYNPSQ